MDGNTVLLTSFQTFFTLDRNPGEDMDTDIIWKDIISAVPGLDKTYEPNLAIKKEIIGFFSNKEFVNHYTQKYACSVKELLMVFIRKQFYAFDKYLVKKLISII